VLPVTNKYDYRQKKNEINVVDCLDLFGNTASKVFLFPVSF